MLFKKIKEYLFDIIESEMDEVIPQEMIGGRVCQN